MDYDRIEGMEGKVAFQTCNKKNHFLFKLEKLKKSAFAVHGV